MSSSTYVQPPAPKPQRPWYKKKRVLIPGGLFALIVLGSAVGGEDTGTETKPKPAVTVTKSVTPTPKPSKTTAAPKVSDDPKPVKSSALAKTAEAEPAVAPAVVGMSVSEAISTLHTKGFLADEEDARGSRWILDNSNWKVCRQDQGPGATNDLRVTIYAVKNHESC